jgi:hypothetical protein
MLPRCSQGHRAPAHRELELGKKHMLFTVATVPPAVVLQAASEFSEADFAAYFCNPAESDLMDQMRRRTAISLKSKLTSTGRTRVKPIRSLF